MPPETAVTPEAGECRLIGKIPVRNIWLLMLYASDLYRELSRVEVSVEETPDQIADLIADILCRRVEERLNRGIPNGYVERSEVLSRVRGRIDLLRTERGQLLARAKMACRFEELSSDTPRNRFVLAALLKMMTLAESDQRRMRCRELVQTMRRLGVSMSQQNAFDRSVEAISLCDRQDRPMLEAAKLAHELALPTESAGSRLLTSPDHEIHWLRKLYEKAIAGLCEVHLSKNGWKILPGRMLNWKISAQTSAISSIFPSMKTDIFMENQKKARRIIIDTKFNELLSRGWHRDETIRNSYVYQMYSYLRSQEDFVEDSLARTTAGVLLHPTVSKEFNEAVSIQDHDIWFATVNLAGSAQSIRDRILEIVNQASCPLLSNNPVIRSSE